MTLNLHVYLHIINEDAALVAKVEQLERQLCKSTNKLEQAVETAGKEE